MRALWISSGVLIWAAHFGALYGFIALACARGFGAAVPWVVGAATLAAFLALAWVARANWRDRREFVSWMALSVAGLALLAVLYQTVPFFIVPICA